LNPRERFHRIMRFKEVDRLPIFEVESYEEETLQRWRGEGLPIGVDIRDYLGLDEYEYVPVDFFWIPRFVPQTLEEDKKYKVVITDLGIKAKISKERPTLVYSYLEHPVKSRDDWEEMKSRLDPSDTRRFSKYWGDELLEYYKTVDHPIGLLIHPFFFRLGQFLMGTQRFLISFFRDPDMVHDMFSFYANFVIRLVGGWIDKTKIDFVSIAEDLAYKHGTHISPRIYQEFWLPYEKKVIKFLRDHGINIIILWSSGNIKPLMPLFLEAGFNCFMPLENAAGINALDLRNEYGKKVLLIGNIAKEALIKGKKAIKKEVLSKIPLIEEGGYMPTVDDMMPPEVSFQNYVYYINLLKKLKINQ